LRRVGALAGALLLATATSAVAHVDVLPLEVPVGTPSAMTVRVPTERDLATVAVRVEIPEGVTAFSVREPPAGWRARTITGDDGRISAIEWRGGRIGVGEYQDFGLLATPTEAGATVWNSLQTYADGVVKPWTAPPAGDDAPTVETGPGDPGPAAEVLVVAPDDDSAGVAGPAADDGGSDAGVWLGVVAIGIAALAVLGVGLLWSSRPAPLPPEETER